MLVRTPLSGMASSIRSAATPAPVPTSTTARPGSAAASTASSAPVPGETAATPRSAARVRASSTAEDSSTQPSVHVQLAALEAVIRTQ